MITACIIVAIAVVIVDAQIVAPGMISPAPPPIFPMGGLGFGGPFPFPFFGGFPFLGGLGFGGLGFGGLGLGLGLGRLGALGRFGLLRGKRDVSGFGHNQVRCIISTTNNTIECSVGVDKQIGCEFEPRLSEMSPIKVNLIDLDLMEHVDGNIEFLNLVSNKAHTKLAAMLSKSNINAPMGTFTFIDPSSLKPVLLGIYANPTLGVPGFLVKDQVCFNSLLSIAKTESIKVKTNLIIA
jgi:hypothetical protein